MSFEMDKNDVRCYYGSLFLVAICMIVAASFATSCTYFQPDPNWESHEKFEYTTVRTLEAASKLRVEGLTILGELYKDGLIDDPLKAQIVSLGNDFQRAINECVKALEVYHMSKGSQGGEDLNSKIVMYQKLYGQFSDLVMPYIMKQWETQ